MSSRVKRGVSMRLMEVIMSIAGGLWRGGGIGLLEGGGYAGGEEEMGGVGG